MIRTTIHGPDLQPRFVLGDVRSMSATLRWNAKSTGTITLPWDHPRMAEMLAPGLVASMDYYIGRTADEYGDPDAWVRVLDGPLWNIDGGGPLIDGVATFTVHDALWLLLDGATAWPVPSAGILAQTSAYRTLSGTLEDVAKTVIQENVGDRLGNPITVEPSSGRGPATSLSLRFDRLSDVLQPLLKGAGLTLRCRLEDGAYLIEMIVPADLSTRQVTEESGTLVDWQVLRSGPTFTRLVAGGAGEGTGRVFGTATSASDESDWGLALEGFVEDTSLAIPAQINAYAEEQLPASSATAGVSAELAEAGWLAFGRGLWVGDRLSAAPTPELSMSDRITEVTVAYNVDSGVEVKPTLGDASISQGPETALVAAITRMAQSVRRERSRR